MRVITKNEFLTLYEDGELQDILVTPIAIVAKTIPEKDKPMEIVVVNIP